MRSAGNPRAALLPLLLAAGCSSERHGQPAAPHVNLAVPAWSQDAIWYQIFVERFRNGDPSNDPTPHDIEGVTSEPTPDECCYRVVRGSGVKPIAMLIRHSPPQRDSNRLTAGRRRGGGAARPPRGR